MAFPGNFYEREEQDGIGRSIAADRCAERAAWCVAAPASTGGPFSTLVRRGRSDRARLSPTPERGPVSQSGPVSPEFHASSVVCLDLGG